MDKEKKDFADIPPTEAAAPDRQRGETRQNQSHLVNLVCD